MTRDEIEGMDWWRAQTPATKAFWLSVAKSEIAADAWKIYKEMRAGGLQQRPSATPDAIQVQSTHRKTDD